MRPSRGKLINSPTVHHCTSRLVAEVGFLSFQEKRHLQRHIRKLAAFCLIDVINHTVMGNHYHTLTRTPRKVRLTHLKLLKKLRTFYGRHSPQAQEFQEALENHPSAVPLLRQKYLARRAPSGPAAFTVRSCRIIPGLCRPSRPTSISTP